MSASNTTHSRALIDVHHHILPADYVDAVGEHAIGSQGSSGRMPAWSIEGSLDMMDEAGIATALTSISSPGLTTVSYEVGVRGARTANDFAAGMARDNPRRFGMFATVPLRGDESLSASIDASIAEIGYALDDLQAEGVCLLSNYHGRYLGDPSFAPLHRYLADRSVVVFVHPTSPVNRVEVSGMSQSMLEFPFETTRTIGSLLVEGVVARFPAIRWILSHAGGALPYLTGRLEVLLRNNTRLTEQLGGDLYDLVHTLYFDTALSADTVHLDALLALASPSHLLFGTDYPFGPPGQMRDTVNRLAAVELPDPVRSELSADVSDLFPRLTTTRT